MTAPWQDVRCASIPEGALSALADLRREAGIRVTISGGRAWVCWDDGPASEATRRILVERLLPLAGVEIFSRHDGRWHRPGERLPAFDLPIGESPRRSPPGPGDRARAGEDRAARERRPAAGHAPAGARRSRTRPAGGRGPLSAGASGGVGRSRHRRPGSNRSPGPDAPRPEAIRGEAEVLLLGPAFRLPSPHHSQRFWGNDVLIPLGYRACTELSERALHAAVGAEPDELVVLDDEGPELIRAGHSGR